MANRFVGKVCLVTASTQGIGLGIALRFVQEGAKAVVICSRKKKNVDEAVKELQTAAKEGTQVDGIVCNVSDKDQRAILIEHIKTKYGKLDVLVPNAASSTHMGEQLEMTERAYDRMWDINVKSTFFLIAECKDLLLAGDDGKNICIISSVTGQNPNWMLGVYAMTKAALDNMVNWLSLELMDSGIRVTGIAPGLIATEFSGAIWKNDTNLD